MRAWAREPAISCAASLLSKSTEALISAMISAGPAPNRPPHILLVPMTDFLKRPSVLAALAVIVIAVAAVLYVNMEGVQPGHPPEVLAALQPVKQPAPAPAVAFSDATGKPQMLTAYRGHYVLLNLWATWCGPCVKELPALAKLQNDVPQGFTV